MSTRLWLSAAANADDSDDGDFEPSSGSETDTDEQVSEDSDDDDEREPATDAVRPPVADSVRAPVFRTALDRDPFPVRTLAELAMIRLSATIRSKPEWWLKRTDPDIRERWKREALETKLVWSVYAAELVPPNPVADRIRPHTSVALTENQVDYVLDELDGYAKLRDDNTGIEVACFDGIWKSDSLFPSDVREALIQGVLPLENVPDYKQDWHPNTDETVLDLVHPSLYFMVYNKTPVYSKSGSTRKLVTVAPPFFPRHSLDSMKASQRFQWLPTDFEISGDGASTRAMGYINNLHPSHKGLYQTIERALATFVPMFERVLTDMIDPEGIPHRIPGMYGPDTDDPQYPEMPPDGSDNSVFEDFDAKLEQYWEEWEENKFVSLPDVPPEGYTGGREVRKEMFSLRGRKVQVIVKLANIHLTPENPSYGGGSWHVEGMLNERIVATGIYYYDQQNVTSNELAFRISVAEPMTSFHQAEPYDYAAHLKTWGLYYRYTGGPTLGSMLSQVVGANETKQDRCIAFPNLFQHFVGAFDLVDTTKPGHRKILVFFLVDPTIDPIPSTTIVPPQQPSWAVEDLVECAKSPTSYLNKLPIEVLNMIAMDPALGRLPEEDAKKLRLEFMEERSTFTGTMNGHAFERMFNLCEH